MTNYTSKIIKNSSVVFIMLILAAGLGYIFRLILARTLSIEEFGLFFAIFAFLNMLYGFKSMGVGAAFIRFVGEYKEKKNYEKIKALVIYFFLIQLIIFGLISIILFSFSKYLTLNYFKTSKALLPFIILNVAFFFSIFVSTFRGFFQAYQKTEYYSSIEFIQTLAAIIITLILLKFGFDFLAPPYAYLFSFVLVSFLYFFLFLKVFPFFKTRFILDLPILKKLIAFSVPIIIGAIASSVISSEDTVLLTYFRSLKEVALYSVAMPTVNMMRYIPKALSVVIFPISTQLYLKNVKRLSAALTQMYKYLFILMVPLAFLIFSFSKEILNIFFGKNFADAAICMSILSLAMIFNTIYIVNQNILIGTDKPKVYVKALFIEAIISTLLDLILIPRYGIYGAAVTALISSMCLLLVTSIEIRKHIANEIPWQPWIKTILVGITTVGLVYFLKKIIELNIYLKLGIILIIASIFYLFQIFLIKLITLKEIKKILCGVIPEKFKKNIC